MEKKTISNANLKEIDSSNYSPGKLLLIINELFNNQKNSEKVCGNILFWESYVYHYFSTKVNYCEIMNQEGNQWVFRSGYETLPLVFKEKYSENMTLISISLDEPNEYILAPSQEEGNRYMLKVNKFIKIEKYDDKYVMTTGVLTVIFDKLLKIVDYEFQSLFHNKMNYDENNENMSLNDFGLTPQFSRTLVICEVLTEMNKEINDFIYKFN